MNKSLIVKTIKTLFQLFKKYRNFLIFKTYLNINNFYVFIKNLSRTEHDLNVFDNIKRFTISKKKLTYLNFENFS